MWGLQRGPCHPLWSWGPLASGTMEPRASRPTFENRFCTHDKHKTSVAHRIFHVAPGSSVSVPYRGSLEISKSNRDSSELLFLIYWDTLRFLAKPVPSQTSSSKADLQPIRLLGEICVPASLWQWPAWWPRTKAQQGKHSFFSSCGEMTKSSECAWTGLGPGLSVDPRQGPQRSGGQEAMLGYPQENRSAGSYQCPRPHCGCYPLQAATHEFDELIVHINLLLLEPQKRKELFSDSHFWGVLARRGLDTYEVSSPVGPNQEQCLPDQLRQRAALHECLRTSQINDNHHWP